MTSRNKTSILRAEAEIRLKGRQPKHQAQYGDSDPSKVLHELQVYQIELEMQNEELLQAQNALEDVRDSYVDLYDFAPVGYLTLTRNGVIYESNITCATLLGVERKNLLNRRFAGFVSHEHIEKWNHHYLTVLQRDGRQCCELMLRHSNSSRIDVRLDCLRTGTDDAPMVRIALTDITERKRAEETLRLRDARFQTLFDRAGEGIVILTHEGKLFTVNESFAKMHGYTVQEMLYMNIKDLDTPDSSQLAVDRMKRILSGERLTFEVENYHKDGHILPIEISASLIEVDGERFIQGFVRDITERKLAAEVIKKSREQLKTFIHQAPICIAMLDIDMNYLAVSGRWMEEYGRGYDDLVGRNHYAVHPNMPDEWKVVHQQALTGKTVENNDDLRVYSDGRKHWMRSTVTPWLDENNAVGGIIIFAEDITDSKLLELEMTKHRNEMEQLQKMQVAAQTASAVAHEVNQPLLAIAAYSRAALTMMKTKKPNCDEICNAIKQSEQQALRAGKSIRDILNFLQSTEFPTETFDFNQEIIDIIGMVKSENNMAFRSDLKLEKGLPFVRANRTHVQKVLINLIRNGIDAMEAAGVPLPAITVIVSTANDDTFAHMTIHDNGPGIQKENINRLFEPFFTTKENSKGIGMGLAISRSLIEGNGGQLWFAPEEDSGATFHLTLPFAI